MRKKIFASIFLIVFSSGIAAKSVCNGKTTSEIEVCTRENFEEADQVLNDQYRIFMKVLPESEKNALRGAQRYWIAYKTRYCNDAFNSTSPGEEAGIDKLACLNAVTVERTRELHYLRSEYSMRDFSHALVAMANIYEKGDHNRVLLKLISETPDANNQDWKQYVDANCKMSYAKLHEERDVCVARMNFYKNW